MALRSDLSWVFSLHFAQRLGFGTRAVGKGFGALSGTWALGTGLGALGFGTRAVGKGFGALGATGALGTGFGALGFGTRAVGTGFGAQA